MSVNAFADLSLEEFRQSYLGLTVSQPRSVQTTIRKYKKVEDEVQIDWKQLGKVTRVKNQEMCGSCWAFCTVGALESAYSIKNGI